MINETYTENIAICLWRTIGHPHMTCHESELITDLVHWPMFSRAIRAGTTPYTPDDNLQTMLRDFREEAISFFGYHYKEMICQEFFIYLRACKTLMASPHQRYTPVGMSIVHDDIGTPMFVFWASRVNVTGLSSST